MNPYGQPQQGAPAVSAYPEQPTVYYEDYVKARSRLRWAFGYTFFNVVANLVVAALFTLLSVDAAQHEVDQTKTFTYAAIAGGSVVFAIALVVLGIFMMRRSRVAVAIAIGLGVIAAVFTLIQMITSGSIFGVTGESIFLFFTVRAYNAVPTVRAYEARHPKG